MEQFSVIANNKVLQAAMIAWISCQLIKIVTTLIKTKKFDFERIMGAGGMPSSHSATVMSASITTGQVVGYDSYVFGLALVFSFIVMYDASGIRRAAGTQAKILNSIVTNLSLHEKINYPEKLKELLGHTHLEVLVGALFGIFIGILITS